MTHSKGPWYVGAQNDALYVIDSPPALSNDYPNHEATREVIAKVYGTEADARLLAAAPDLLAACEAALPALRWYQLRINGNDLHSREVCRDLEAAVIKAHAESVCGATPQ